MAPRIPALSALASVLLLAVAAPAAAASWSAVPGAPDVEVDLASIQPDGNRVAAWLRIVGAASFLPRPGAPAKRPPGIYRTAVQAEFDCSRRTVRALASTGYASSGAALFMSSVPGPAQPVRGEEMSWAFDALCEAARAGA